MHFTPTLTLHRHLRPIHLIDRRCDIADAGVCPTHTHIHTTQHFWRLKMCHPANIWRKGNLIFVHSLGGLSRKDEWRPFHLSWSHPCNPVALTDEVKIVKLQNVQLLGLQGICRASDCIGGLSPELFVSIGVSTCLDVCVHAFTECVTACPIKWEQCQRGGDLGFLT